MRFAQSRISRFLLAAVLVVGPVAGTALAKRPSHTASTSCSSPTVSGPASAAVGDTYRVEGCGFEPSSWVPLQLAEANGCCSAVNAYTDSQGEFFFEGNVYGPGSYTVTASSWHQNRWRVASSWSFEAS